MAWGFPGSPAVKTSPSNAGGAGLIPGWGAKIPHALRPKNQKTENRKDGQKNLQTLSSIHIGGEVVKRSCAGQWLALTLWVFKRQQSQNAQLLACWALSYKTLCGFP